MPIVTGQTAEAADFINQAEKDAAPPLDEGRVPKFEADGKLSVFFTKNGAVLNAGETLDGGTLPVPVYQSKADNELYACDGNDLTKLKFIGFVTSDSTNGNPITFQSSGVVGGFSGLDEGEKYYLSDTAGAISTTPGTYPVLVGVAISETELFIQKAPFRTSGTHALGASVSNQAITTGFRPSKVRITGYWVDTSDTDDASFSHLTLVWKPAATDVIHMYTNPGTGNVVGNDARLYAGNPGHYIAVGVGSVTDTGFTITLAETGTFPGGGVLLWEAEGDL